MEAKTKDGPKTKDMLKQLQAELRQLQNTVTGLQSSPMPATAVSEKTDKSDWAVQYAVHHQSDGAAPLKTGMLSFTTAQLARVGSEAVATLGNAISAPQKVALLRALLAEPQGESAPSLGSAAGLSTGSLYHHLHDLMHAGLIGQAGRSHYVLTDRGRRVLLVLLALASQH